MKIYTEYNTTSDSVEVLLNYQELKDLSNILIKFEDEIKQFKIKNKGKEDLGLTHLHLIDCDSVFKNGNVDVVFYVDLNENT